MVLRSWERSRPNSREMNGIVSPKSVRPVYSPTSPTMPQRVDPRYGALVCSPFLPGYGGTVPAMFPFNKNDSLRLNHPSHSPAEKQNDRLHITRTSSANSAAVSPPNRVAGSHSPKKNGFSINELLHDSKGAGNTRDKKDTTKIVTPDRLCQGAEISNTNKLSLSNETDPTLEDKKLLEKCKNLDRLRKTDFMRGNIETLDRIRETPYFQRFLPPTAFSHPSLLPPGSLALQLGLQSHPGFLHPPSVYHPFHPSTRSSSPPPLGVPIPVPVYLRGRSGATSSEAARVAKKCRRSRTVFTELQLMGLEKRFEKQKYLSTPDRLELAETLGLSQLQVKTWYQNRRMKWKKQVLQGGGQEAPTKPKGRPKKSDLVSMETTTAAETNQSDESDIESVASPMSQDSSHISPLTSPLQRTPSPKPLMPL